MSPVEWNGFLKSFRDPTPVAKLCERIHETARRLDRPATFMEVCGTHTMSIARHGLRSLLPPNLRLISGPGCPVCVTPGAYLEAALWLAQRPDLTLYTFGDLMRVPGSGGRSLAQARAHGADVRTVYSPLDSVQMAASRPESTHVFLGVGFETTAPAIAASIKRAAGLSLSNFFVLTAFKRVMPALEALTTDPDLSLDGFLCPAHVSAILGSDAYRPLVAAHRVPCVIAGFEPLDILLGVEALLGQLIDDRADVENRYTRVVHPQGNESAQRMLTEVLEPADASWRGLGTIPASGLVLRNLYSSFDAAKVFPIPAFPESEPKGCRCGEILKGRLLPPDCPLFGRGCTPAHPVGACMVSSEGSCAAYYNYGEAR